MLDELCGGTASMGLAFASGAWIIVRSNASLSLPTAKFALSPAPPPVSPTRKAFYAHDERAGDR